jgi:hypothetical protein
MANVEQLLGCEEELPRGTEWFHGKASLCGSEGLDGPEPGVSHTRGEHRHTDPLCGSK